LDSDRQNLQSRPTNESYSIQWDQIEILSQAILDQLGLGNFELSVDFIDPTEMADLNYQFRQKNKPTDVLSFPQQEWPEPIMVGDSTAGNNQQSEPPGPPNLLGDIVICPAIAEANALAIGHGLDREICFLLVHGILHLGGHDHEQADEEAQMKSQQKIIMGQLCDSAHRSLWENCVRVN
jgi:probable rRNA maturation factor